MDAAERELFAKGLQAVVADRTGVALDAALGDLGWRDALADDPHAAVAALFEAQGGAGATSSALDAVVLDALGVGADDASGVRLVLPALGGSAPPGAVAGSRVAVRGVGLAGLGDAERTLVVAAAGAGDRLVPAVVAAADLDLRVVHGLDPALGLVEVGGEAAIGGGIAGRAGECRAGEMQDLSPSAWAAAVAAGQRAVAHELVGASRAMLGQAREHAVERIQFGRPIAQFQAVRHRLAESLVAIEAADAALAAAWDDATPFGAAVAKAIAGRSARTVARHAQQVLAGIGFTTEHPLHRYVRRVVVLDRLLGDARTLTRSLGEDLLARRTLPSILPL